MEPIRSSPRNELIAVASRQSARAQAYAQEWSIAKSYGTYQELLDDPKIEVIYNSLPNGLHAVWTVRAVEAGKHVLCEKPLAISLSEVDRIIEASRRTERVVAEAFMYRHHPQTILVKDMIGRGAIGEIRLIKGAFTFSLARPADVRLDKNLGGGCLWDVGCYPISYMRYILDRSPAEVFGWQITGDHGVDEVFSGQMRFDGGVLAQFDCSFRSPFRASMEIVGSMGILSITDPFKPDFGNSIRLESESGIEIIPVPDQSLYLGEVEDLADAILNKTPPRISLAESRANVYTILALLESARIGIPVSL
jgi:predicted dehydrogenase